MIDFLENLYRICMKMEEHSDALGRLLKKRDHPNWEAHAQYNFSEVSNNIQYFKSRLIEFDNAINGVTAFDRRGLDIVREDVQGPWYHSSGGKANEE